MHTLGSRHRSRGWLFDFSMSVIFRFSLCKLFCGLFAHDFVPRCGQQPLHSLGTLAVQRLHNLICCDRFKRQTPDSSAEPVSLDETAKERTEHA